jgi:hypothetical protein
MTDAENEDTPYTFQGEEAKDTKDGQSLGNDAEAAVADTADVGLAETNGSEPAEPDSLDGDDPLHGLVERTRTDPGAPYEMEALVALRMLRRDAPDKFARMLKRLKVAGCGITDLRKALADIDGGGKGDETQADILIEIANVADLFHTSDLVAYADMRIGGYRETWPVRSKGFRRWLLRQYYDKTKGAPNSEAMQAAIGVIEAKAHYDGPEQRVHIRIGGAENGTIYVDLCDEAWRAVEIDAIGWRIVDEPPLRFRRSPGMLPLPVPVRGGSIDDLRPFLNIGVSIEQRAKLSTCIDPDTGFVLTVAWALAALNPNGPFPVLSFAGEQGTAKSTAAQVLRSLVDPNAVPLRTPPRDDRDMFISANNAWMMVYDNLSSMSEDLADAMCRLATGGGFAPRALYTDADEVLFNATRPQILNHIEDIVTRPDLADRCLFLTLEPISDEDRLAEKKFWADFAEVQPGILGALLDGVSEGLRRLPEIVLPVLPRMADFALWVTACERAFWPEGTFMAAYVGNLNDANALLVEASIIAPVLKTMVEQKDQTKDTTRWSWDQVRNVPQWSGTATQLLAALEEIADEKTKRSKGWPGNASALSGKLRRVATVLRKAQPRIDIEFDRKGKDRKRTRTLSLFFHATEEEGETPSAASAASAINENNGLQRTGPENAAVRNVQRSVRFADSDEGADGGTSDADGRASSDKVFQGFENASFSNFADAADAADAVSSHSSIDQEKRKLAGVREL